MSSVGGERRREHSYLEWGDDGSVNVSTFLPGNTRLGFGAHPDKDDKGMQVVSGR